MPTKTPRITERRDTPFAVTGSKSLAMPIVEQRFRRRTPRLWLRLFIDERAIGGLVVVVVCGRGLAAAAACCGLGGPVRPVGLDDGRGWVMVVGGGDCGRGRSALRIRGRGWGCTFLPVLTTVQGMGWW